jgi:hypothetical protein
MTKRCRCCPVYTPNRGGVCTKCLDAGVLTPPAKPKYRVLTNREIEAMSKGRGEPEPHAVLRGRGLRVPA